MKALILSDLHFEQHRDAGASFVKSLPQADVLICAGDLSSSPGVCDALRKLVAAFPRVVYTYGNHEFYGSTFASVRAKVQNLVEELNQKEDRLHVLDNSACVIEGRRFVGSTLWFKRDPLNTLYKRKMPDFSWIHEPEEAFYRENDLALTFLQTEVSEEDIVVTHHLPSFRSVDENYNNSPLNRFFVCDMAELILERQPKLWVHGHTHSSCDYGIDRTQVLCNPFGYVQHGLNPTFLEDLIVSI